MSRHERETTSKSGDVSPRGSKAQEKLPSQDLIKQAAEVTIYDAEAKPVLFESLYGADDGQHRRVMVIFIRHFFCGMCQEYLKALAAGISPAALPEDVSIAVIGCGAASLIPSYIQNLGFKQSYPFPIYADQSKKLYSLFEMQSNLDMPPAHASYFQRSVFAVVARSAVQSAQRIWHGDAGAGGPISQHGGEILYEVDGNKAEVSWLHRMKNVEDHTEIDDLKIVLKLDEKAAP